MRNIWSHGHRAENPCCCKFLRTVRADTCCLEDEPIFWFRAYDVIVPSVKCMLVRCLYSRLLVIAGHWDPARHSPSNAPSKHIDFILCRQLYISTDASSNATIQWIAILVSHNATSIKVRHSLVSISFSCTRHHYNFSDNNVQIQLVHENPTEQLLCLNEL